MSESYTLKPGAVIGSVEMLSKKFKSNPDGSFRCIQIPIISKKENPMKDVVNLLTEKLIDSDEAKKNALKLMNKNFKKNHELEHINQEQDQVIRHLRNEVRQYETALDSLQKENEARPDYSELVEKYNKLSKDFNSISTDNKKLARQIFEKNDSLNDLMVLVQEFEEACQELKSKYGKLKTLSENSVISLKNIKHILDNGIHKENQIECIKTCWFPEFKSDSLKREMNNLRSDLS